MFYEISSEGFSVNEKPERREVKSLKAEHFIMKCGALYKKEMSLS
jgi:hypothetical protein